MGQIVQKTYKATYNIRNLIFKGSENMTAVNRTGDTKIPSTHGTACLQNKLDIKCVQT
jgi:hypothetical protein